MGIVALQLFVGCPRLKRGTIANVRDMPMTSPSAEHLIAEVPRRALEQLKQQAEKDDALAETLNMGIGHVGHLAFLRTPWPLEAALAPTYPPPSRIETTIKATIEPGIHFVVQACSDTPDGWSRDSMCEEPGGALADSNSLLRYFTWPHIAAFIFERGVNVGSRDLNLATSLHVLYPRQEGILAARQLA